MPSAHSFLRSLLANLQAQISDGEDLHPAVHDISSHLLLNLSFWENGMHLLDSDISKGFLCTSKKGCFHKINDFVV